MKHLLFIFLVLLTYLQVSAQNDMNPYVINASITPVPLYPVEFNGTGEIYFEIGNDGTDDLPLVADREMTLIITLSDGVPNNIDPIAAIGGSAKIWFDWTYDSLTRTYTAKQNQLIPGSSDETITIQYEVFRNTPSNAESNGFNVNLQPPPYSNGFNNTLDDATSDYTHVLISDYGDAPSTYGEAVHDIDLYLTGGLYTKYIHLGATVDPESTYLFSADALGDDEDGSPDDEDGVTFPPLIAGTTVTIPVIVTSHDNSLGFLYGWVDWNANGVFDASELIESNLAVPNSQTVNISVTIPGDAVVGQSFARFRIGAFNPTLSPVNANSYGEVEDYEIEILEAFPSLYVIKNQTSAGSAVGQFITYDIVVTNTGNVPITNIGIVDANAEILNGSPIAILNPGETSTVTAQHQIVQADIDQGYVENIAIAIGDSPVGTDDVSDDSDTGTDIDGNIITDPNLVASPNGDGSPGTPEMDDDPTVTPLTQSPALTIEKLIISGSPYEEVNDVINYSYEITNIGNVTLAGSFLVTDDKISNIPAGAGPLAPGSSVTVFGSYTITQTDLDAGSVVNIAYASTTHNGNTVTSPTDTETATATPLPALTIEKLITNGDPYDAVGDVVDYSYEITNSGNVTLSGPFTVTDDKIANIPPGAGPLSPGESVTVTGSYTITQPDLENGSITNIASASTTHGGNTITSPPDTETATASQIPELLVIKNQTSTGNEVGEFITYDIIVENTGNITVSNINVTDGNATILTGNPVGTLVPGASAVVTARHEITQGDIDLLYVENSATATGDSPFGEPDDVTDVSDTGTDRDGNPITSPELVASPNGNLSPGTPDMEDDLTVTLLQVPDVTPIITATPNVMHGVTNFNIFVEVTELNFVNTEGLITVRIPKDSRWIFNGPYDNALTILGSTPLDNIEWSYGEELDYYVFESTTVIPAGSFSTFGFKATYSSGETQGVFTITSQIESGSGSENRINNNVDAEKVDYFIN